MTTVNELTKREMDEAKDYGLSLEKYIRLKDQFTQIARQTLYTETVAKYKDTTERELRSSLKTELHDDLMKQVESELSEMMLKKAREELLSDKASVKERQSVREFAREVELDALTNARAASMSADASEQKFTFQMLVRRPLFYGLLFGFGPIAYYLYHRFGLDWYLLSAILGPWIIGFFTVAGLNSDFSERTINTTTKYRKTAGGYARVAERAKRLRMVETQIELSRRELQEKLNGLVSEKSNVDQEFTPSSVMLDESRKKINDLLITETDASEFLRVDIKHEVELKELEDDIESKRTSAA